MGAWIFLGVLVAVVVLSLWVKNTADKAEQAKIDAMGADEREAYLRQKTIAAADRARNRQLAVQDRQLRKGKAPISSVGKAEGQAGLACPKCGGGQFKARRSTAARATIGAATVATGGLAGLGAAAVTRQKQVQCVTCGAKYMRG